jgi:hypothetical protein
LLYFYSHFLETAHKRLTVTRLGVRIRKQKSEPFWTRLGVLESFLSLTPLERIAGKTILYSCRLRETDKFEVLNFKKVP